jgi:hypothetical protein
MGWIGGVLVNMGGAIVNMGGKDTLCNAGYERFYG